MEKRIILERRGQPEREVVDLNLDNCRSTQISGLTEEFVKLEALSLINVGLTSLKGFPSLPSLKRLELSDNRISGGLQLLNGCPKLSYVNLSGNKIKDIKTLEPLKELKELRTLDLYNCDVTNEDSYRDEVFDLLQSLEYLDGFDRDNEEAEDEDAESVEHTEDVHDGDDEKESGDDDVSEADSSDDDDVDGLSDDNENVALGFDESDADGIGFVSDDTNDSSSEDDVDNVVEDGVADESESLESELSGDQAVEEEIEEIYADENLLHGKKRKFEEEEENGD